MPVNKSDTVIPPDLAALYKAMSASYEREVLVQGYGDVTMSRAAIEAFVKAAQEWLDTQPAK
jgi:hypothetical protein